MSPANRAARWAHQDGDTARRWRGYVRRSQSGDRASSLTSTRGSAVRLGTSPASANRPNPGPGIREPGSGSIQHSEAKTLLDARQPIDRGGHLGDLRIGAWRDHERDVHAIAITSRRPVLDGKT